MAKNPLIRKYDKKVNGPLLNKSAGILDDHAVRKVVATKEGSITRTPTADIDIANKKYVDDTAGGGGFWSRVVTTLSPTTAGDNIETTGTGTFEGLTPYNNGTADLGSVGFKWRSLFLSSDASVGGNINVTGTVDGIDIATDVAANTLKETDVDHNVTTNLSLGAVDATTMVVASSDGTDATLVEADTTNAGILGSDKWDEIVANTLKATNVTTNITIVEAPTNVSVQSSDGTNDTIAAADVTNAGVMTTTMYDEHVVNTAHALDSTQAHSDYLLNSGTDIGVGLTLTGDNSAADTQYTAQVLYNTDATPPAASGFPIGTIYIQYTA